MHARRLSIIGTALLLPVTIPANAQFAWDGDCGINWYDCCLKGEAFVNNWTITPNPSACPALPGATDTVSLSDLVYLGPSSIDTAGMFQSGTFLCDAQTLSILDGDILTSGQPDDPGLFRLNGIINLYDDAIFEIGSFSTLDFQSGQIRHAGAPDAKLVVSGLGTLTRSAPNGSFARIDVPIDNQGLVRVTPVGENMWILGGGVSTGLIDVLAGATLHMQGAMTLDGEVSGGGLVHFGGGTTNIITEDYHPANTLIQYGAGGHTVNFEAENSIENLTLSNSGSLGGAADLSIDDLKWYAGQMLPGGTVSVQDTALFQGTMDLYRHMELHGTSIMPSAWLRMQGAELRNYGDLELQGSTTIDQFCCAADTEIKNFDSLRKTGGGIAQLTVLLSNANVGEVHVESGELRFNGGMNTAGPITLSPGTTIVLGAGQQTVGASGSLTGNGTVEFYSNFGWPVNIEGDYDVSTTEIWSGTAKFQANSSTDVLHLYDGTLLGEGDLIVNDYMTWWNGAPMSGAGTTRVQGEVRMGANGTLERTLMLDDVDPFDPCVPEQCSGGNLYVYAPFGELRGNGTVEGHIGNAGFVSPGGGVESPGTILRITGNYSQQPQGTLSIDLTGDALTYDQVHVLGSASLGGTLTVAGSSPPGQSFTILTASSLNGTTFGQVNLPRGMTITYTATSVIVQTAPGEPCPADVSPQPGGDAVVDVDDLLAIINDWGACNPKGDCVADIAPPQGNGVVDVDDLLAVINSWGPCR
jgi:hypothetical protein